MSYFGGLRKCLVAILAGGEQYRSHGVGVSESIAEDREEEMMEDDAIGLNITGYSGFLRT